VGSAQASELVFLEAVSNINRDIQYYAAVPYKVELPIYITSPNNTAVTDDACAPLPDDTPDLSGYVTVVRRGYVEACALAGEPLRLMLFELLGLASSRPRPLILLRRVGNMFYSNVSTSFGLL